MKLTSDSMQQGTFVSARFALGQIDPANHMIFSDNLSPHLAWDDVPDQTRSFALLCVDPDVPTVAETVNSSSHTITVDQPRCDFYHWSMINISASLRHLAEGTCARGLVRGGKRSPEGPAGTRQGLNGYSDFFAGSELMGDYFGYDGPCPPWNDDRMHHYHFTVYALSVEQVTLSDRFTGVEVGEAIRDSIIDQATLSVRYSLNPVLHEAH